jgi:hypothetical protein
MNIPYNNGKIEMGKYYQRPKYVEYDQDMLMLQEALVGDVKAIRRNKLLNAVYVAVLVVAVFAAVLFR